ncbi:MAG: hypothetical protein M1155_01550 [Patescibacteria group bacterium]|nr:hypothetical protein [Patescibacteria group bacterium]
MPVRNDKGKEYEDWKKKMLKEGLEHFIRLTEWFFNLIDLGKMDIGSIIYIFGHTCELYEMFGISDGDRNIIISIRAVADFHDKGEEFRIRWNSFFLGEAYVLEMEVRNKNENKRYVYNPYEK